MASAREVKVGAFVLVALGVIGVVVFLIGEERQLFETHATLQTAFKDVQGLKRGSPVRMGGVDVGSVTNIGYGDDPNDDTIYVELEVVSEEAERIRVDSEASIEPKGLLGDKMLVITVGDQSKPAVTEGEMIRSHDTGDMEKLLKNVRVMVERADRVVENLEQTSKALADVRFHEDVRQAVRSLSSILKAVDEGDGYMARLLHDPNEAKKLSNTVSNLERASGRLDGVMTDVQSVVQRVEKGPGFAHEAIYGADGSKALAQFGGAAEEVSIALKGIREGDGLANSLLYGDEGSSQMLGNLNQMSADLRAITSDLREGKGTIGALLVDPSVYEDMKILLGNVGRNRSLRALVRYSIEQDESSESVKDPGAGNTTGEVEAGGTP